ncbi:MAG: hypothetical protein EON59_05765 [Alphaproteobacteria bacterium]|nr:MAG: hypothetical protein EON59_05765 [Alphaproteobacteria bacterium]
MNTHHLALTAVLLLSSAQPALAAEIILERTAVQKLVEQSLFNDKGRYYVSRGACTAYFEEPSVTLKDGRIVIRSHLSGRFGADVGGSCVGVGLASWTTVSGTPTSQGTVVRLDGIRVDEIQDPSTQMVLNSGLVPSLPRAIELDVFNAVKAMLQGSGGQIQADVQRLNIQAVSATDSRLSVRFDFTLIGK